MEFNGVLSLCDIGLFPLKLKSGHCFGKYLNLLLESPHGTLVDFSFNILVLVRKSFRSLVEFELASAFLPTLVL